MSTNSNPIDATQLLDQHEVKRIAKAAKKRISRGDQKVRRPSIRKKLGGMLNGINSLLSYSEEEARRFHEQHGEMPAQPQQIDEAVSAGQQLSANEDDIALEETNRFTEVLRRIEAHPDYRPTTSTDQPYGTLLGRHIIGEHTKITGGIYVGVDAQEAIVIDEKYGSLEEVYTELMLRYVRKHGTKHRETIEHKIIQELIELTKEKIRYSSKETNEITKKESFKADQKVALDIYLEYGFGTDRHQMLLAAYLLEKLMAKGLIKGKVYLDGHYASDGSSKERLIYSSANGYLFIFTPSADQENC